MPRAMGSFQSSCLEVSIRYAEFKCAEGNVLPSETRPNTAQSAVTASPLCPVKQSTEDERCLSGP